MPIVHPSAIITGRKLGVCEPTDSIYLLSGGSTITESLISLVQTVLSPTMSKALGLVPWQGRKPSGIKMSPSTHRRAMESCPRLETYNGLTIGVETGDDAALAFMRKGYASRDILEQCRRLEQAGIEYGFFYLTGISGKGRGEAGAKASAEIFNQLHPFLIGPNMLTVYPESGLYQEIQSGNWEEEGEFEKYRELRVLVEHLSISTYFAAMGASNAFQLRGRLPEDRKKLLDTLDQIITEVSEDDLRHYRKKLRHL